jgi:hypothetical protein
MQYKKPSPKAIRQELLKVRSGIIKVQHTKEKYFIPTKVGTDAKQIYRSFGIKPQNRIQAIM